jgi:hypothetical protein
LAFHAYVNEMHGSRKTNYSKKSRQAALRGADLIPALKGKTRTSSGLRDVTSHYDVYVSKCVGLFTSCLHVLKWNLSCVSKERDV